MPCPRLPLDHQVALAKAVVAPEGQPATTATTRAIHSHPLLGSPSGVLLGLSLVGGDFTPPEGAGRAAPGA